LLVPLLLAICVIVLAPAPLPMGPWFGKLH